MCLSCVGSFSDGGDGGGGVVVVVVKKEPPGLVGLHRCCLCLPATLQISGDILVSTNCPRYLSGCYCVFVTGNFDLFKWNPFTSSLPIVCAVLENLCLFLHVFHLSDGDFFHSAAFDNC